MRGSREWRSTAATAAVAGTTAIAPIAGTADISGTATVGFRPIDNASSSMTPSQETTFEVIPAVDVQDGQVVQLVQGQRGTEKTYGDPVEAATRWIEAGARSLHLVDLDGAFEGERRNAEAIDAVLETVDVPTQLGGGIRTAEGANALLERGLDRVILGTAAVESPEIVAEISDQYPGSVVVSLDAKDGEVVVEGWTESAGITPVEAAARYEELGAGAILFTNVDVEGQLEGVRADPVRELVAATDVPVIASGGVASLEDVATLREAGAAAVVVGSALYEGAFSLSAAQRVADGASPG